MPDTFQEFRAELVDTNGHLYRDSRVQSAYIRDEGLLVIPVMGPAGTAPSVVRVHAPYGVRRSRFRAEKENQPPLFPPQADTDSGDVILHSEVAFPAPAPNPDGRLVFAVSGEYTFVQPLGGRGPDNTYPIDRHPFPTAVDRIGSLPPPGVDTLDDSTWWWNCEYIDARLLCSYNLLG